MDKWAMWVAIAATIGFPIAVYSAITAYHHRADARVELRVLQQHDARMDAFRKEVTMFREYQDRAQTFLEAANQAGVVDDAWDRRRFDVEDRMVSYSDLSNYIRKANHGSSYYFVPEKLDLKTPEKAMQEKTSGSVFQYYDRTKSVLSLTMRGELLVKNR
ncbi:MAG: hypothetical protein R8M38_08060 [Mariprofundaceae bacterium]